MAQRSKARNQTDPDAITLIRAIRLSRGWTQDTLGQAIRWKGEPVSRQTVDKWEKDQQGLNLAKLEAVAKAFELSLRDLLPGRNDEAPEDPLMPLSSEERRLIEWSRRGSRERMMALVMSGQVNDTQAEAITTQTASDKRR